MTAIVHGLRLIGSPGSGDADPTFLCGRPLTDGDSLVASRNVAALTPTCLRCAAVVAVTK